MELADLIERVENWCHTQPIALCVLFGSQATGQVRNDSDVDLAIWPAEAPTPSTRLGWLTELETLLAADVSLVLVSADLDPVLGMEIVRHGCLIFECEPELWTHRRQQLWHAFNDSLPFRRAARHRLHEFAEEVRRGA